MEFDKRQPTDTTKIRNLGVVIRPNWVAIEEGDDTFRPLSINLQNRTPSAVSNDPTTLADTSKFYCKDDGSGTAEVFNRDAAGNIIQITEAGRVGGPSTNFKINNYRFGSGTVDYSINNIVSAYVRWNSAGTAIAAFGCTVVRASAGVYTITLTTARNNTNYVPVATAFNQGNVRIVKISIQSTTQFQVRIENSDQSGRDTGGFCQVVGGF